MISLAKTVGPLDARSTEPLYQQLQRALRVAIDRHVVGPAEALPVERELAAHFKVSRVTVRRALDGLVKDGMLVRRHGSGNFVSARVERNMSTLTSFSDDIRARGQTPRSVWLSRTTGLVTPDEAFALRVSPGARVHRFHRLRYADDTPMALDFATILATALPSSDVEGVSLYEALEATGHRPVRALQRVRAVLLSPEQTELLKTKPCAAGLFVERVGSLQDGRTVEFTRSYFRGEMYDFVTELSVTT
jgi:GntR family transcriptional regulator